jgi:hypothetical protein
MPTSKDKILVVLQAREVALCDDCLSKLAGVTPRQQVNQICRPLADAGTIERNHGPCGNCGGSKLVNRSLLWSQKPEKPPELPTFSNDRDRRINDIYYELTFCKN